MVAVGFGLMGLVFGSFLNVVVYRMPRQMSVVGGRSVCPSCGTTIRGVDNIPVVSYVALGGRCRSCRAPISAEYPVVEALTAVLFVLAALVVHPVATAALVAPFLGVMLAAALIDIRFRIIPNRLVYPSLIVFALAVVVVWATGAGLDPVRGLLGLLAYGGALFVVALIAPAGMGMGDVKLAALIGMVLGSMGWAHVAVAAAGGVLFGGLGAVGALLAGRGRKDTIPFGPYLALGAMTAVFLAVPVADWYREAILVSAPA